MERFYLEAFGNYVSEEIMPKFIDEFLAEYIYPRQHLFAKHKMLQRI